MSTRVAEPGQPVRRVLSACLVLVVLALVAACGTASSNDAIDNGPGKVEEGAHPAPTLLPRRTFPTVPGVDGPETTEPGGPATTTRGSRGTTAGTNGPPYAVGVTQTTFTDSKRSTPSRGAEAGKRGRTFATRIRYPAQGAATSPESDLPAATGPFPLIIFVHGYNISADRYEKLLHDIAAAGYVVAAPEFPGTSSALPGQPIETDVSQQPGDVTFLITELQNLNDKEGALKGVISAGRVGVVGHSDGGNTAAALAFNGRNREPRVGAAVLLAAERNFFQPDTWFPQGGPPMPPMLGMHADTDQITKYKNGQDIYNAAPDPKWFVTLNGADHLSPFTDGTLRPAVTAAMVDFLDGQLRGDKAALEKLKKDGNTPPLSLRSSP